MAKEERVLEMSGKGNVDELFGYAEAVKSLVAQRKQELDDLLNKISMAQIKLSGVEKSCQIQQAEHNQRLALEKQNFEKQRVAKLNEFANRDELLSQAEHRQNDREMNLKARESDALKLTEERKLIYNERIEFEKLKNQATVELSKTLALQTEVQHKVNAAALKEQEADKKLMQAEAINAAATNSLNLSQQKEKDILQQIDNLQKIRKDLQPKLDELKAIEKTNDAKLKEANEKLQQADNKLKQDKELIAEISAKNNALKSKELEIATREEEVLRREMRTKK